MHTRGYPASRACLGSFRPLPLAAWWMVAIAWAGTTGTWGAGPAKPEVEAAVRAEVASLVEFYRELHRSPELSFHEQATARRLEEELRRAGFEVTGQVGGHGLVGILRNGEGPVVLLRADLDALPVKEQTGLPYASRVQALDDEGKTVDVMHACGHDIHMTVLTGTARMLTRFKDRWRGTALLIGQPAEERGSGARRMLRDGLFRRFPKPDVALALHVKADLPAGFVGITEGYALANVDMVDVVFPGVGGHGAWPHTTKDPVVLAAQAILAYQTIVSRETEPGKAAVVTVGSVHGGAKHNIIPDEVRLQLTLRSFTDEVRANSLASLERITRHMALAAGMPTNRLPTVQVRDESCPSLYNDPEVAGRLRTLFGHWLGTDRVAATQPVMGGEDFSEFGRTSEKVPLCMFWLGAVSAARFEEARKAGSVLPALHSSRFEPDPEPTIHTGVTAMTAAALGELTR